MLKIRYFIFIFLLSVPFYVEAFDPNASSCNLDEVVDSGYSFDEIACDKLTISSYNNVDYFKSLNTSFDEVVLGYASFYDLSFLANSNIENLRIVDSVVDLRSYEGNVKSIDISRTIFWDDDFSGLKRNKRNFKTVRFDDCFVTDFSTFPVEMVNSTFMINYNRFAMVDLTVMSKFKGNILVLDGIGYNLEPETIAALEANGVVIDGVDTDLIGEETNWFVEKFNEIPFDNPDVIAPEDYERISLELADRLTPSEEYLSGDSLHNYISGNGDSYTYAIMGALMYNLRFTQAFVTKVNHRIPETQELITHYIIAIMDESGEWKYSDPYYLDFSGNIREVGMGLGWPNLYFDINASIFSDEYQYTEDVLKKVDQFPSYVIFKSYDKEYAFVDYATLSDEHFQNVPEREGMTFDGWYLEEDFKTKVSSTDGVRDREILYAKWISNTPPNTDEEEKNPNTINPPNTGGFIVPIVLILSIVMLFITYIGSKKFRRVFRI